MYNNGTMNFKKIFEMQKLLDKAIMTAHNVNNNEEIWTKRVVALLVELGEFANEYAPFKYWKKNIVVDRKKLLEEFIDGIHFFASMAIDCNLAEEIKPIISFADHSSQLLDTFSAISAMKYKYDHEQVEKAFALYLGLAVQLQISEQEIIDAYVEKNKVNYERIAKNY